MASDTILWQPTHGERKRGRPRRTCVDQLMEDTLCNVNELKTRWTIKMNGRRESKTAEQARPGKVSNIYIYIYKIYYICTGYSTNVTFHI